MNAYRFTVEDESAARAAMRRANDLRPRPNLVNVGARALGCTEVDLREVELQWLENEAGEIEMGL